MKKQLLLLLLLLMSISVFCQDPVLNYSGDLYFIPGSMTKSGEAYLVTTQSNDNKGFTIYDGDFNVVRSFTDPVAGTPYQQRIVTLSCVYDLQTGSNTRAASDWTVVEDQIVDNTMSSTIEHFEMYSDNNDYHSRALYVSQTLFDNDDEFEYVRKRVTIVPISTNLADYEKEHSTNSGYDNTSISWGSEEIDNMMKETGADSFEQFWDEETGKFRFRLYKHQTYGGLFVEGVEVATLDGTVKAFLPGISYLSSVYIFRGKCYVRGRSNNSNVLYLLGSTTGVKEIKRDKAQVSIRQTESNLIVESCVDGQTIVLSNMGGQVLRNVKAVKGNTLIPLQGLMKGIYNITLFQQSQPVASNKIIVK